MINAKTKGMVLSTEDIKHLQQILKPNGALQQKISEIKRMDMTINGDKKTKVKTEDSL